MSITAMKQALEALQQTVDNDTALWEQCEAITALRAAIAEQEKCEPVVYQCPRCATSLQVDPAAKLCPAPVPAGWQLVPVEPTEEMIYAYLTRNTHYWNECDNQPTPPASWRNGTPMQATKESYKAMLAAAPKGGMK